MESQFEIIHRHKYLCESLINKIEKIQQLLKSISLQIQLNQNSSHLLIHHQEIHHKYLFDEQEFYKEKLKKYIDLYYEINNLKKYT